MAGGNRFRYWGILGVALILAGCNRPDLLDPTATPSPRPLSLQEIQPFVDSPCSWTSSHEPSPFFAKGRSTVPEARVCSGGSYGRPGPDRKLRAFATTRQLGTSVGVSVGPSGVSLGVAVGSSVGVGVSLGFAAAVILPSARRVATTLVSISSNESGFGIGVAVGSTRSGRLQAASKSSAAAGPQ